MSLTTGVWLAAAPAASADQVWNQSVGRASADAACPASDPADLAAGWSPWEASWEEWPNDGMGGFACSRSITWAKDTPPPTADGTLPAYPSAGCVQFGVDGEAPLYDDRWIDFGGGWWVDGDSLAGYDDAGCTIGQYRTFQFVYAPAGYSPEALCIEQFGTYSPFTPFANDVYRCNALY